MASISSLRPVVKLHEVFTPNEHVTGALNNFLDKPVESPLIQTSAYRLLHAPDYMAGIYDEQIHQAEKLLEPLARAALHLSGRTAIETRKNDKTRLLLEVREQDRLDAMAEAMNVVRGIEDKPDRLPFNVVYFEFATDCLAKDIRRRTDARDKISSKSRHPALRNSLQLTNVKLSLQHIPRYILPYR